MEALCRPDWLKQILQLLVAHFPTANSDRLPIAAGFFRNNRQSTRCGYKLLRYVARNQDQIQSFVPGFAIEIQAAAECWVEIDFTCTGILCLCG